MFNTHDAVDEVDGVPNPFLDIRVREAANLAINREAIIEGLLTGVEEPSYGTYKASIGFPRETLAARYTATTQSARSSCWPRPDTRTASMSICTS